MICPACENVLHEITLGGITVDVCKGGCGGIWFDHLEIQKVDEPHESAGESLLDTERDESLHIDHSKKRLCPRCEGVVLMRHFYSVKKEVEVDECARCGGFWLDSGELAGIRTQFQSELARKKAAEDYFSEIFGDEMKKIQAEGEERLKKARNIARMFRFICPSYYIPGKQDWGAF